MLAHDIVPVLNFDSLGIWDWHPCLTLFPPHIPVLVTVDSNHVLGGVQELFATVRPRPGAGSRVGVKLYPEIQALPFFNVSLSGTGATQHGKESLFWKETKEVILFLNLFSKCLSKDKQN